MVVLGFYLSLTKFNIRYLLISLLGISIEAIGACVHCVNNIYASSQSRRKPIVDYDDPTLTESGLGLNCTNSANVASTTDAHLLAPVTHMLSNQALTSVPGLTNNIEAFDNLVTSQNNTTAISDQPESPQPDPHDAQGSTEQLVANSPSRSLNESFNSRGQLTTQTTVTAEAQDVQDDVNGNISSCSSNGISNFRNEQLPSDVSNPINPITCTASRSSDAVLTISSASEQPNVNRNILNQNTELENLQLEPNSISTNLTLQVDVPSSWTHDNVTHNESNQLQLDQASATRSSVIENQPTSNADIPTEAGGCIIQLNDPDSVAVSETLNQVIENSASSASTSSGLIVTGLVETPPVPKRRLDQAQHMRAAHLRRTLVMGLGGEEELIEINEEDLDNMSVLPPSYDSIATTIGFNSQINESSLDLGNHVSQDGSNL